MFSKPSKVLSCMSIPLVKDLQENKNNVSLVVMTELPYILTVQRRLGNIRPKSHTNVADRADKL